MWIVITNILAWCRLWNT